MTVCIKGKLEGKYIPSLSNQRLPVARRTLLSSILPAPKPHQDPKDNKQKLPCCLLIVHLLISTHCSFLCILYKWLQKQIKQHQNKYQWHQNKHQWHNQTWKVMVKIGRDVKISLAVLVWMEQLQGGLVIVQWLTPSLCHYPCLSHRPSIHVI